MQYQRCTYVCKVKLKGRIGKWPCSSSSSSTPTSRMHWEAKYICIIFTLFESISQISNSFTDRESFQLSMSITVQATNLQRTRTANLLKSYLKQCAIEQSAYTLRMASSGFEIKVLFLCKTASNSKQRDGNLNVPDGKMLQCFVAENHRIFHVILCL